MSAVKSAVSRCCFESPLRSSMSRMDNLTRDLLATYYGFGRQPEDSLSQSDDEVRGNLKKSEESDQTLSGFQENDTQDTFEDEPVNSAHLSSDAELDENVEINEGPDKIDNTQDKEIMEKDVSCHHSQSGEGNSPTTEVNVEELPVNPTDVAIPRTKRKSGKSLRSRTLPLPALPKRSAIWNETFVDLTNNGLLELPGEILDKYSGLRMLYLANNDLSRLPEELFTCLQRLEWFDVRDNHLTSFPKSIKSHPCVETLLLQGNSLEELPLEVGLAPKLRSIQVAGNSLQVPPKVVMDLGSSAILDYLRTEWNKAHPEDPFAPNKKDLKSTSTLICCQTPRYRKPSVLSGKLSKSRSSVVLGEVRKRGSTGKRYKPSNRYSIPGSNISRDNIEADKLLEPEEEIVCNVSTIDEINRKIEILSGPNGPFRRTKNICEDAGSYKVHLPSIDLARLDSARQKDARRTSSDLEERTFEIVTNDRKNFQVRPLHLNDPNLLLSLLEKCVGLNK